MRYTFLLSCIACGLSVNATNIAEGSLGESMTWSLTADSVLTISGEGVMPNYSKNNVPWYSVKGKIKKLVVGEGVTAIGTRAFYRCLSLNEVSFPNTLESIGQRAFDSDTALTRVVLPASVTGIAAEAFLDCRNIDSVFVLGDVPPMVDASSFNLYMNYTSSGTSYVSSYAYPAIGVPTESLDAYKEIWKTYADSLFGETRIATLYGDDGLGCKVLFTENEFTPTDNSILLTTQTGIKGHNVVLKQGDGFSCNVFKLADAKPIHLPFSFKADNFIYERPLKSSVFTFVLPAELPITAINGDVYAFAGFDGENLQFERVVDDKTVANRPYMVKVDESAETLFNPCEGVELEEGGVQNISCSLATHFGVYTDTVFTTDSKNTYYCYMDGLFYKINQNLSVKPFRTGVVLASGANKLKALGLVLDGNLLGVAVVENERISDSLVNVYDLNGRLVKSHVLASSCLVNLPKGTYVVNGSKFVVR